MGFQRHQPFIVVCSFSAILFFSFVALFGEKRTYEETINMDPEAVEYLAKAADGYPEGEEAPEAEVAEGDQSPGATATTFNPKMVDPDPATGDPRGLLNLLREDKLCDAYLMISGQAIPKKELVNTWLKAIGMYEHPYFREVSGALSPVFQEAQGEYESEAALFLVALRNGRLLRNAQDVEFSGQLQTAFDQLDHLAKKDPRNAIYPYMQLVLMQKMNPQNKQGLIKKGFDVLNGNRFYDHYFYFLSKLEETSRMNTTTWVIGQDLLKNVPLPDFELAVPAIAAVTDSVPGIKEHLTRIMTSEGVQASRSHRLWGYDPAMYTRGRAYAGNKLLPQVSGLELRKGTGLPKNFVLDVDATNCSPAKVGQLKQSLKFVN